MIGHLPAWSRRAVGLVLILAASVAAAASPDTPTLGATLDAAVMRGQFVQKKYLAEMDQPLVSSGHYVIARDRGLLWQVQRPVSSQLVITPDALTERSNGRQTAHITADQQPALAAVAAVLLAAFQGNVNRLRRFFNVTTDSNAPNGWALTLVPRTAAVRQVVSRLKIAGKQTVRHIRIDQPGGDHSEIALTPAAGGPPQLTPAERSALAH